MTIRQLAAFTMWAAIVAVSGCQSTPPVVASKPLPAAVESGPQDTLARAKRASGAEAAELYLAASLAFAGDGQLEPATNALAQVDLAALPSHRHASFWLTGAQLTLLQNGNPARVEEMLQQASQAPDPDRFAIAELRARLCMWSENVDFERYACAVRRLTEFVPQADQVLPHHEQIWDLLNRSPATMTNAQIAGSTGNARGWWELKAALLGGFSVADQRRRFAQWRQRWSEHPANQWPPAALQALLQGPAGPRHVALFLPLSGPLARAGRAVRDGFVSAHLHSREISSPAGGMRPDSNGNSQARNAALTITVFDSAAAPIPLLLERALLQGADLVVGPLEKARAQQINALNPLIPVLTLNYLDEHTPVASSVLQLGLAIEDEADTIVSRLLEDNIERALIFHTYQDWSRRAAQRIRDSWPLPITVQAFTDIRTITESVGEAMDVQASQARHDELARTLGTNLEFLPRARQDVEAIVALVNTLEAKALAPALRFHFAQGLPVYASSQTVRGARPEDLQDLSGFLISELPWFLSSDGFYQSMDDAFGISGNPFSSLYALGVDAFRVSDRLPQLDRGNAHQLLGSTGILSMDQSGRIHRQLGWGVVSDGALGPLGSIP